MRLGIAHHLGWAVAVCANASTYEVVDRRRVALVDDGLPAVPIHHEGGTHALHRSGPELSDGELEALVARVRASVERCSASALDALPAGVTSISLRAWGDLPTDIAALRRPPHEAVADSVMYRVALAEAARARGWTVHLFDAARVEGEARARLGARADDVLLGPRSRLGAPWTKDHRVALAATIIAS